MRKPLDIRNQLDIFNDGPLGLAQLAAKRREAAEHALRSIDQGHFTARERHDFHAGEAERLERLAATAAPQT